MKVITVKVMGSEAQVLEGTTASTVQDVSDSYRDWMNMNLLRPSLVRGLLCRP